MQIKAAGDIVSTHEHGSEISNMSYQPTIATQRPNVTSGHINGNEVTREKAIRVRFNTSCSD